MKSFAVIGNPIAHSLSPTIHQLFGKQTDINLAYQAICCSPHHFAATVDQLKEQGFTGVNVTTPFKQQAFTYATTASSQAQLANSANTLTFNKADCFADNTDGQGLLADLSRLGHLVTGKKILILGAGGAARATVAALLTQGPDTLFLFNRTKANAIKLRDQFNQSDAIKVIDDLELNYQVDGIINATSAGLYQETFPFMLPKTEFAYDLSYGKAALPFLQQVEKSGCFACHDGLGMLVEQAALAFFIWHGVRPATEPVLQVLKSD